jgi:hypothetical protein
VIRNRFETTFSMAGGKYMWFAVHNALGVLGPALVFLHGNLLFSKWPSVGVWAMIFVVASGFLGQYLANQLPAKQYRNTRERQDLDKGLMALSKEWGEHTRAVNLAELMLESKKQKSLGNPDEIGTLKFLFLLVTDDVRRFFTLLAMRVRLISTVRNRAMRRQLFDIRKKRLTLERQDRFYKTAGRLVSQWRLFHIFFSIGLFLLMLLHVLVVTIF